MNNPRFLTFTGIDEKTNLNRAKEISEQYPVEFGLLLSATKSGNDNRYPGQDFFNDVTNHGLPLALHICGKYAAEYQEKPRKFEGFQRIQINSPYYDLTRISMLNFPVICQYRKLTIDESKWKNLYFLFDRSSGNGIENNDRIDQNCKGLFGYAGGLTPDNIVEKIQFLKLKNYWMDMETGVRSSPEEGFFCLDKVARTCENVYGKNYQKPEDLSYEN